MNASASLLDELRSQCEAVPEPSQDRHDVESFETTDRRMRKAFRWLEQAIAYLDGLTPPIDHRFDLGYGFFFASPRFAHGSVGLRERRITGFPVANASFLSPRSFRGACRFAPTIRQVASPWT